MIPQVLLAGMVRLYFFLKRSRVHEFRWEHGCGGLKGHGWSPKEKDMLGVWSQFSGGKKGRRAGGVEEANGASTEQLHIVSIVQSNQSYCIYDQAGYTTTQDGLLLGNGSLHFRLI